MVSVPYLSSEWCGKEWNAFDQRHPPKGLSGAQGTDHQSCIVPVRWAPVESALPSAVSDDMFFAPKGSGDANLPKLYRENGVFGLYKIGREDALPKIGWELSLLIARIYKSLHLEHREFAQEDLNNMFEGWRP